MTGDLWREWVLPHRVSHGAGGGREEARKGAVGCELSGRDLKEGEQDAVGVGGEGAGEDEGREGGFD